VAIIYFGLEAFYPGGAYQAAMDYGETQLHMQEIDPTWNSF
jgi:hypothetical protein